MSIEAVRGLMNAWKQVLRSDMDVVKTEAIANPTWQYKVVTRKRIRYWPSMGGLPRRWK